MQGQIISKTMLLAVWLFDWTRAQVEAGRPLRSLALTPRQEGRWCLWR